MATVDCVSGVDPAAVPLLGKKPVDVTPRIEKRAYELYERESHREDHAVQGWLQAEREILKDKPNK